MKKKAKKLIRKVDNLQLSVIDAIALLFALLVAVGFVLTFIAVGSITFSDAEIFMR